MATAVFPILWETPRQSANTGNAFPGSVALTATDRAPLEFVDSVDGQYEGGTILAAGAFSASPTITAVDFKCTLFANATTGVTHMNVLYKAIADGESMNPASLDAATVQAVTVPATAYLRKALTFSLTPGDFAVDDLVLIQLLHQGTHGSETLAVNTLIDAKAYLEVTYS